MKIQTMSIIVGSSACNARCPFCIARTTPEVAHRNKINWRNFDIACKLADKSGATTALLTGKGEPTLFPELITTYLEAMNKNNCFPIRELQTNGIMLTEPKNCGHIKDWYNNGLTTICLSAVHYNQAMNAEVYGPSYPDIKELTFRLREIGFTVRLSVMLLNGYIDTKTDVRTLIDYCRDYNVKQLTIRPITCPPEESFRGNQEVYNWIQGNKLPDNRWEDIKEHVSTVGNSVLKLAHGAEIFDYEGQNICLGTCITTNESSERMRQIIFQPDGTIGYDWKYTGANLL